MSISTHNPEPEKGPASLRSEGTITCSICQAVYTPEQEHAYLSQAPRVALESAFMSMCHFCFRCRRPACPSCWDYVHGVCGSCTLEAGLPFRSRVTPLRGVVFPPIHKMQLRLRRSPHARLSCIRPGRFQSAALSASAETMLIHTLDAQYTDLSAQSAPPSPPASPVQLSNASSTTREIQTIEPYPQHISLPPAKLPPASLASSTSSDIDRIATRPGRNTPVTIDEIPTSPGPRRHSNIDEITSRRHSNIDEITSRRHSNIDEIPTSPGPRRHSNISEIATGPKRKANAALAAPGSKRRRRRRIIRRIERVSVGILAALLLCIVLLSVLAEVSPGTNTIILHTIHIDIQAEIAYILQLIKQFFS